MADFKSSDEVMQALNDIVEKLSSFKEYEKTIDKQCKNIETQVNSLKEQMGKHLSDIETFEKTISEQTEHLAKLTDSVEGKVKQCSEQIEMFVKKSAALTKSADELEKYMDTIKRLSRSIESQVEDAKDLQNKLMIEKLDILISKAEKLTVNNKDSETQNETKEENAI